MFIQPEFYAGVLKFRFCSRDYLPPNISKFNAYAVHGKTWGEISPAEQDKRYESLYPIDPETTKKDKPDFHFLPAFQPIDLTEIGYEQVESYSALWKTANSDGDHFFT